MMEQKSKRKTKENNSKEKYLKSHSVASKNLLSVHKSHSCELQPQVLQSN